MLPISHLSGVATVLSGLLSLPLLAQTPTAERGPTGPSSIQPTPYAQTITAEDLRTHLTILAADDMEGRETGTPGQKRAADYIARQFAASDLKLIVPGDDGKNRLYAALHAVQKNLG